MNPFISSIFFIKVRHIVQYYKIEKKSFLKRTMCGKCILFKQFKMMENTRLSKNYCYCHINNGYAGDVIKCVI